MIWMDGLMNDGMNGSEDNSFVVDLHALFLTLARALSRK